MIILSINAYLYSMKRLLFLITLIITQLSFAQTKVFKMEIKAPIDPRTNRYTELALEKANEEKADLILVEMDTYGGAVNDADEIRQRFLDCEIPIYVFINKNAASAGALISIACDSIYMTSGANIGAATVVNGSDGAKAPDKYQSYMRSMMRSTAEAKGRDPKIAEAMVDENLKVDSVSQAGQVITFTTSEAIENGFCEAKVASVEEILERSKIADYEIIEHKENWSEKVIQFFLNPAISGVLILIMMGGIYFELQSPGIGFPIAAAILAAIFYFTPFYMNGLAENWEIIVFIVGLVLIALEVFVIPGFGIAGIAGITLALSSLFLVMINNVNFDFTFVSVNDMNKSLLIVCLSLIGSMILVFVGAKQFAKSKAFSKITLTETMTKEDGYVSNQINDMLGKVGEAHTVLRPSGKIKVEDKLYDAEARNSFIEKGIKVEVIGMDTSTLIVKEV